MRHGQSKANEAGVIVSRIETDRGGDWGLSELGRRQALAAAERCGLPADTVICSSDFSRARQTAEIVRAHLGAAEVTIVRGAARAVLRRPGGDPGGELRAGLEADNAGAGTGAPSTRSAASSPRPPCSTGRPRSSPTWNGGTRGRDILLVSHGDTLQILQAGFLRMDPSSHRRLPHLDTAQIRELRLGEGPAPVQAPLF